MRTAVNQKASVSIWLLYALTVCLALMLKRHYSLAAVADLAWVLGPTAQVVEHLAGMEFFWESGVGYVDRRRQVIIAESCAGVNFMIMAYCMAVFTLTPRPRSLAARLMVWASCLPAAYLITIMVNAVRIRAALWLYAADIHYGWLTAARLHRMEGIVVYYTALWVLYMGMQHFIARGKTKPSGVSP